MKRIVFGLVIVVATIACYAIPAQAEYVEYLGEGSFWDENGCWESITFKVVDEGVVCYHRLSRPCGGSVYTREDWYRFLPAGQDNFPWQTPVTDAQGNYIVTVTTSGITGGIIGLFNGTGYPLTEVPNSTTYVVPASIAEAPPPPGVF
jgi:hypothetical protein